MPYRRQQSTLPAARPVRDAYFGVGGLERGELAVHDVRDLEELRAIERCRRSRSRSRRRSSRTRRRRSRPRSGTRSRRRRCRGAPMLAHLQRQPLLVGVLVHEERRRLFVAGDEPAADERVAEAVEIGRVHLEPEPLGEPVDEALFLGRPDLDRPLGVGRVERVRERRLARERRRRAGALDQRVAAEPAEADAERRAWRRRPSAGASQRRGPTRPRWSRAPPRRAAASGIGSASTGSSASRSAAFCARMLGDARRELRIARRAPPRRSATALGRELAVDVRVEVGVGRRRRCELAFIATVRAMFI